MKGRNLFLISLGLLFLAVLIVPVQALNNTPSEKVDNRGYINSSYTAEKEVTPDTVDVSIAVKTENALSLSNAIKQNKEISDKIYAYLKGSIDTTKGDYLKTSNFSANPTYNYSGGKRVFNKYEVSNNIIVHTKNIDKIGVFIDKSLSLGATNVDSLHFSLSEKDSVCSELLKTATKKSRDRADVVVAAANSSISGIKSIDTACNVNGYGSSYSRKMFVANSMVAGAEMADGVTEAGPSIEAGVIKVYATVNANYFLK